MVQRVRENEQIQQNIKGTEDILFKGCTTGVRNYDQNSSGRPDYGTEWNSLHFGRFLDDDYFLLTPQNNTSAIGEGSCNFDPGAYDEEDP
ncbi:hypothetical protein TNCV_3815061 [Trichonephila clavipes]|nr:hypothetical protein TNCV_3815061 [Trichonephila clavipes]